jgi:hypothetical protein
MMFTGYGSSYEFAERLDEWSATFERPRLG